MLDGGFAGKTDGIRKNENGGGYNFLGLEPEINGAEIIFEGNNYSGTIAESEFAEKIIDSFEFFNFLLGVHGRIFGSISNDLIDEKDISRHIKTA